MRTQTTNKKLFKGLFGEPERPVCDWLGLICFYQNTFFGQSMLTRAMEIQGDKKPKWIFRGQDNDWPFTTTLDRAFEKYGIPNLEGRGDRQEEIARREYTRRGIEQALLRSFMRKAHHYLNHIPDTDDLIEWLAIVRHYGAPTRMLDWTYSFYVAVYNAVESWVPSRGKEKWPVVWALDAGWLSDVQKKKEPLLTGLENMVPDSIDKSRHEQNLVVKFLMETPHVRSLVYNATGFRLNERLSAQQGTFLVQACLSRPFYANLKSQIEDHTMRRFCTRTHFHCIELRIDRQRRDHILRELNNMNINHATLYPDLEGFAKSLERHMAYPEHWGLDIKKEYQ